MTRLSSIFSQMVRMVPRALFDQAVAAHEAERSAKGFSSWAQFVSMLFCHLGGARSLREITNGLAASEGKLRHLGLGEAPRRSTLAYANEHRPWEVYRDLLHRLSAQFVAERSVQAMPRFKHKLLSLDASVVPVWAKMFDGRSWQRAKGAGKLHLVLEHDGYLPHYAVVTEEKEADLTVARTLEFPAGSVVVFDRGYTDYAWWQKLKNKKVHFVTRLKDSAAYGVAEVRAVPKDRPDILRDEIIILDAQHKLGDAARLRRVEIQVEGQKENLVFVTSHLDLSAADIAAIYKERWHIELFFKALKQTMRIKTFVGTSANAILTQIYTALIALLLIKYLQWRSTFAWSLSNLVALLRQQIFVYRPLLDWLNDPWRAPPEQFDSRQAALPLLA